MHTHFIGHQDNFPRGVPTEINIGQLLRLMPPMPTGKYRILNRLFHTTTPAPASDEELLLGCTPAHLKKMKELADDAVRTFPSWFPGRRHFLPFDPDFNGENPISHAVFHSIRLQIGGTILAARLAFEQQTVKMNLGGGMHHAFPGHAEGFCHFNDIAVAIYALQNIVPDIKVMYVDLDVHHGQGTAYIFRNNPQVYIFDIFQNNNYPLFRPVISVPHTTETVNGNRSSYFLKEEEYKKYSGALMRSIHSRLETTFRSLGSLPSWWKDIDHPDVDKLVLATLNMAMFSDRRESGGNFGHELFFDDPDGSEIYKAMDIEGVPEIIHNGYDLRTIDSAIYLPLLEEKLEAAINEFQPDLIIYNASADTTEHDKLGGFSLTSDDMRRRDKIVLESAFQRKTKAGKRKSVPVAILPGSGYAPKRYIVNIHCNTAKLAVEYTEKYAA